MTVFEHVAYPLELRGVRRATVRERVTAVLEMVGLAGLETRPATMLSGGQMQRLALCRALVYEPDLLLLDEPFSSLDAKLREQMRVEVKLLQRRLGVTVLFVTHDQLEALSLSDRRLLARTDLPGRGWLEFAFWAAFFLPTLTVTLSWILLLDPEYGLINVALARVLGRGPFDIYSFWGIVWVHVVTGSLTVKVILLTPAFRNMNAAFEEASYVAGGTTLRTALRITVPLMAPAILSVLLLGTMVSMQTFEVEQVLGLPFRFFVFSTSMMRGRSTTGRTC
jgi:ABC-type molybdate transport system permease subunit